MPNTVRPYHHIPIADCQEELIEISPELGVVKPHPYQNLGAKYDRYSPHHLRRGVVERLLVAQQTLQQTQPGWQLAIFDGYRPVAVQKFMVEYTFNNICHSQNLDPEALTLQKSEVIWARVLQVWAFPDPNPATPPPHSTGAAVDLTLFDHQGKLVDMGSPIDELSDRSLPDYYPANTIYYRNRYLLHQVMTKAGFQRHPQEWWHFSWGDQMWAWLSGQTTAIYGRVE